MHPTTAGQTVPRLRRSGLAGRLTVLAIGIVVAACSSGGTSSSPSPTLPPASTTPTEAASEAPQLPEYPADDLTIMAPAAPGGGWDSTARAMQQAIGDAGLTSENVEVYNVAGAGGTVGLAQFVEQGGEQVHPAVGRAAGLGSRSKRSLRPTARRSGGSTAPSSECGSG